MRGKWSYAALSMDFDTLAQQVCEQNRSPGFSFLVYAPGRVVFAKGYGLANVALDTPVTPETRFAIGSLTKQFTAAAVLLLREQGSLRLEDRLETYVPGMPNGSQITLRMLLHQTSGLHNFPDPREHNWPREGRIAPDQIVDFLKTDKPDFAPGERWAYSNANYALLAQVIAWASGIPYGDFLSSRIFNPLGMTKTGDGFAAQAGTATPYERTEAGFVAVEPRLSLDLFHGAGSMVSTAQDLARWSEALLSDRLLSPESIRELWAEGRLPGEKPTGYAMGFVPARIGSHRELWHDGHSPRAGGYCFHAMFPDDALAVIVLANGSASSFRGAPEQLVKEVLSLYDRERKA